MSVLDSLCALSHAELRRLIHVSPLPLESRALEQGRPDPSHPLFWIRSVAVVAIVGGFQTKSKPAALADGALTLSVDFFKVDRVSHRLSH